MIRLAADRPRALAMGALGRDLCRQRFDWRTMVQQIESVYTRLLSQESAS